MSRQTRRTILNQGGAVVLGLGLTTTTAAAQEKNKENINPANGGASFSLGGDNAMSPEEMTLYAREVADKHDNVDPEDVAPHAGYEVRKMGESPDLEGIGSVGAWNSDHTINTEVGNNYADVENAVTLY